MEVDGLIECMVVKPKRVKETWSGGLGVKSDNTAEQRFLSRLARIVHPDEMRWAAQYLLDFLRHHHYKHASTLWLKTMRMARLILETFRSYKARRNALLQRMVNYWQAAENSEDWCEYFVQSMGRRNRHHDQGEQVPVWALIARPITRTSKYLVVKTLYRMRQVEYLAAWRVWHARQRGLGPDLSERPTEMQNMARRFVRRMSAATALKKRPLWDPEPRFSPVPETFFLVVRRTRKFWLRLVADVQYRSVHKAVGAPGDSDGGTPTTKGKSGAAATVAAAQDHELEAAGAAASEPLHLLLESIGDYAHKAQAHLATPVLSPGQFLLSRAGLKSNRQLLHLEEPGPPEGYTPRLPAAEAPTAVPSPAWPKQRSTLSSSPARTPALAVPLLSSGLWEPCLTSSLASRTSTADPAPPALRSAPQTLGALIGETLAKLDEPWATQGSHSEGLHFRAEDQDATVPGWDFLTSTPGQASCPPAAAPPSHHFSPRPPPRPHTCHNAESSVACASNLPLQPRGKRISTSAGWARLGSINSAAPPESWQMANAGTVHGVTAQVARRSGIPRPAPGTKLTFSHRSLGTIAP